MSVNITCLRLNTIHFTPHYVKGSQKTHQGSCVINNGVPHGTFQDPLLFQKNEVCKTQTNLEQLYYYIIIILLHSAFEPKLLEVKCT